MTPAMYDTYRLLIALMPAIPSRPTMANIPIGVNVGTSAGGGGDGDDVCTFTTMVPVFVPPFESTVTVPVCVPSESPAVLIITVTVPVSVPPVGLTVIHG